MKSWKIGAIAGLIAGLVAGIVYHIFYGIGVSIGLDQPYWRQMYMKNVETGIVITAIWGMILGIVFFKTHNIIPGNSFLKGLLFGFVIFIITPFRIATFWAAYGNYIGAALNIFAWFLPWIIYGLLLGILFNKFKIFLDKRKIVVYDLKGGILPGAISGICGGIVASIVMVLGSVLEIWKIVSGEYMHPTNLLEIWIDIAGTHMFMNMIWGIVFGIIYTKAYNIVPKKGIWKGLIYGMIVFSITTLQVTSYFIVWGLNTSDWLMLSNIILNHDIVGFFQAIAFGLVLGLLYRKPTK